MSSDTVVTVGLTVAVLGALFLGWRAAIWVNNFASNLRAGIISKMDELQKTFSAALEAQSKEHQQFREETSREFRAIEKEMSDFKLDVARNYVTKVEMQQANQLVLERVDGMHKDLLRAIEKTQSTEQA